jgi:DNA-binding transcriptional regulator YiaG
MPNVASVLKEEITRLARSETKKEIDPLKARIQELKKIVAQQKKQIAALEKAQSQSAKKAPDAVPPTAKEKTSSRKITTASVKSQRKRLGLSQREMGLLVGVSTMTIVRWEQGKGSPRGKNGDAFVAVRGMGRRQVKKRLEELAK